MIGRRPSDCAACGPAVAVQTVGRYFAENARLEAASVTAFRLLRSELAFAGRRARFCDGSSAGARDEIRTPKWSGRLAQALRRTGAGIFRCVRCRSARSKRWLWKMRRRAVSARRLGSCLDAGKQRWRRTRRFDGRWPGLPATKPDTRALSWQVANWLWPRFDAAAQARVRAGRWRPSPSFATSLGTAQDAQLQAVAGLPTPP